MKLYPHKIPIILNDTQFVSYGGQTGTSTASMRTASYLVAEQQVSKYIGTLLLPTQLTGQAHYFSGMGKIVTDWGYVQSIGTVRALDDEGTELYTLVGDNTIVMIRDDTYGYILVSDLLRGCGTPCTAHQQAMTFEYPYVAGLPTGTANQPGMLMALAKASQLILNELYEVTANESTGDVGVIEFSILRDYTEKRKAWKNTIFGSSPAAAWIARMIDSSVKKARKALMFGVI